ncbi:MAG: pyruvate, phosphate dikinase, partial [Deltaproteobacteria bacterium]|nr:pyruvate, phosphate dikinase [Deltaproteobacteria bacterium]
MTKYIYTFGDGQAEGSAAMKSLLGGKGAGLAEMCKLGLPVPPGFTITTEACNYFYEHDQVFPKDLEAQVLAGLKHIETIMGQKFGGEKNPLLISVRSGARASMPGMMDTVLNLGVPPDPRKQLWEAIRAVFQSWMGKRAQEYRRIHRIPRDWGTACNIQAMVFGNRGETSGTGVAFTRDPSTGEKKFFGEYLINAQGEEVVAGIRTPEPVEKLKQTLPGCYAELEKIYQKLERHYKDMQDMEFTIQEGKLWMLQTRNGKRTGRAAVKIAVDMEREGLIDKREALLRVDPKSLDQLLHPMIDPKLKKKVAAKGLAASPGAAVGRVVFTAEEAVIWAQKKEPVILVRQETSAEDIHGMFVAKGILTSRGGITSHAAVVARGMGKVCVAGCEVLQIDPHKKQFLVGGKVVREGDWITIDGSTGEVMLEKLPTVEPAFSEDFQTLMAWADQTRKLKVRANADTPKDAELARELGAEGIGLCRTEHMFFAQDRVTAMQEMILAETTEARKRSLAKIAPMQRNDFKEIFKKMRGLPVTIRLLDPPLHEFLPQEGDEKMMAKAEALKEVNPMLGFRGCRLGIVYPEIYEMQVQAVMEAACELTKEGIGVLPEIEIPLVGLAGEISKLRELCEDVCRRVMQKTGQKVDYKIGT